MKLLSITTVLPFLIVHGCLRAVADPPEFAQDSNTPKAFQVTHPPNKWREFAWCLTHYDLPYDILYPGSWWELTSKSFQKCISADK
jgi:hypothetical protein